MLRIMMILCTQFSIFQRVLRILRTIFDYMVRFTVFSWDFDGCNIFSYICADWLVSCLISLKKLKPQSAYQNLTYRFWFDVSTYGIRNGSNDPHKYGRSYVGVEYILKRSVAGKFGRGKLFSPLPSNWNPHIT